MADQAHWETVYQTKAPDKVSWYAPHLALSLDLIRRAAADRDSVIIDVGGGESTLVDDLLADGYRHVDVLDLSRTAVEVTRTRLGAGGSEVVWRVGDVTTIALPPHRYDVWHDRAVFHFLTDAASRAAYVANVVRSVKPGGHVIVATFGPEGPTQCSGLDVSRYDAGALHDEFGARFRLVEHAQEIHRTPWGAAQQFVYCLCVLGD